MDAPIALHSVAHRVSHQIPAESEMSRQNRATPPPTQGVAPFSRPPCRTFHSFAAGRGRGGPVEGIAALLDSKNGSRYRGVSQLQSHQSRYSVQLSVRQLVGHDQDAPKTGPSGCCIWNLARQLVLAEIDVLGAACRAHLQNLARQPVVAEINLRKGRIKSKKTELLSRARKL